ncbi:MAG: hypothetical protein HFG28_03060 [Eubacterium sp.]|nr:hypothetical protein [Eubacterium sp.]
MKRVYICSPLGGDVRMHIAQAKKYALYALKCGMAPVVPHFYALILDDDRPEERKLGKQAGISLLWVCDEMWVFGEEITSGMEEELRLGKNLNLPVRYIDDRQIH